MNSSDKEIAEKLSERIHQKHRHLFHRYQNSEPFLSKGTKPIRKKKKSLNIPTEVEILSVDPSTEHVHDTYKPNSPIVIQQLEDKTLTLQKRISSKKDEKQQLLDSLQTVSLLYQKCYTLIQSGNLLDAETQVNLIIEDIFSHSSKNYRTVGFPPRATLKRKIVKKSLSKKVLSSYDDLKTTVKNRSKKSLTLFKGKSFSCVDIQSRLNRIFSRTQSILHQFTN